MNARGGAYGKVCGERTAKGRCWNRGWEKYGGRCRNHWLLEQRRLIDAEEAEAEAKKTEVE